MNTEPQPWWETIERLLKALDGKKVDSICIVTLLGEDEPEHDYLTWFHAGTFELSQCAGILQMVATKAYIEQNSRGDGDESEEDT